LESPSLGLRLAAEVVGTFLFFVLGFNGIAVAAQIGPGAISSLGIAFGFGLGLALAITAFGHISGGHFNPAITLGFVATRRIKISLAGIFWLSQFAGAVVAAAILRWLLHMPAFLGAVPKLAPHFQAGRGMVVELILTFFLVGTVFATAVDPRGAFKAVAGLTIGLMITIDVFMGGPLTGAAMNPARAFGPELVSGHWPNAWIYYVGPALGGLIAAVAYDYLFLRRPQAAAASS
jgi:aquaporin Z